MLLSHKNELKSELKGGRVMKKELWADMLGCAIGALIGGYLFRVFGIAGYGIIGNIVMATAGAVLLLVLLKIINRRAA